jgi:hypothetical protein
VVTELSNGFKVSASMKSSANAADTTSTALQIAVFTLTTSNDASPGSLTSISNVSSVSLVSTSSRKILDEADGLVFSSPGFQATGNMYVEESTYAGIQVYVDSSSYEQELVNFASLGDVPKASSVMVKAVLSCHTVGAGLTSCAEGNTKVDVSTFADCVSMEASILKMNGCNTLLDDTMMNGGDVDVQVSYNDFKHTSTLFRIWVPQSVEVSIRDPDLNLINTGKEYQSGCDNDWYQWTQLTAVGNLKGPTVIHDVDLTSRVIFQLTESSNRSVATINNSTLTGLTMGNGSVTVFCSGDTDVIVAPFTVLSNVGVEVKSLEVYLLTDLNMGSLSFGAEDEFTDANLTVTAVQSLTAEGDSGIVFTYVHFSDDNSAYVSEGLAVNSLTTNLQVVTAVVPAKVEVPFGAVKESGITLLNVSLFTVIDCS